MKLLGNFYHIRESEKWSLIIILIISYRRSGELAAVAFTLVIVTQENTLEKVQMFTGANVQRKKGWQIVFYSFDKSKFMWQASFTLFQLLRHLENLLHTFICLFFLHFSPTLKIKAPEKERGSEWQIVKQTQEHETKEEIKWKIKTKN